MDNSQPNPIQQQPQQPQTAVPTQPGAPQQKSGTNTVLIVVIVLVVLLFLIPLALVAFVFAGVGSWVSSHPEEAQEFVNELERSTDENYVAGTWNCAKGTGSSNDRDNYSTTLKLKKDMTFIYGPYGDLTDNHYSGTYTFKDEDKHTADGSYDYYMIDFDTDEAVIDGEDETDSGKGLSQMEMGITKTKDGKQAITIFTSSYNMYYCYSD